MTDVMSKAVCWELATNSTAVLGMRVLLAGQYVGTQELNSENARPRWKFSDYGSAAAATEAALGITESFEKDWVATLIVPPGEIALHPTELARMGSGGAISPALRARIFTSLQRRDPRLTAAGGVPSAATT